MAAGNTKRLRAALKSLPKNHNQPPGINQPDLRDAVDAGRPGE